MKIARCNVTAQGVGISGKPAETDTKPKEISPARLVLAGIPAMGAVWKGPDILMTKAVYAMDPPISNC